MYYDRLKRRVKATRATREAMNLPQVNIVDCIAPCYLPIHDDVINGTHSIYHLPGGRGSGKSSFVSLEIVHGIMNDPDANAIVFRKVAQTMRESVFSQIIWAIEALNVSALWRASVSPMQCTYLPTGQTIFFRGLDDSSKLKSIRPRKGTFKFVWFEEFSELDGANMVRNVLQSVVRGGNDFRIFESFNPPLSLNNWANKYVTIPDDRALLFRTNYTMIPPEWLGEAFILEAERLQAVNERAYLHEYMGEPVGSGGEVFPTIQTREITQEEIDAMQYHYIGVDFGFSTDPTAFVHVAYDRKKQTVYFIDEYVKRGMSNTDIADMVKDRMKGYERIEYSGFYHEAYNVMPTLVCDAAEPKSINDLQKQGLKAIACKKYPGSVIYGIKWLQSKILVFDPKRTPKCYEEFSQYEYLQTKDGEFLADVPDKDNHCIDGCRYALDRLINSAKYSA